MNWKERIVSDEKVLLGKPAIKGTRLGVAFLLDRIADGWTEEMLLENYPRLTREDLEAVLAYVKDGKKGTKYMTMENILEAIRGIIHQGRETVARSINQGLVLTYWNIGRVIVEEEMNGKERSDYGSYLIKKLSKELVDEYGESFSSRDLFIMRQFFVTFPIVNTLYSQLTWSHYMTIIRIEDAHKREFYIAETTKNAWSVRQMERQIGYWTDTDVRQLL